MRFPAYGRQLMEKRAAGAEFWLALVAVGWLRDGDTLRGQDGVARIGCPLDAQPGRLDWRCVLGMDVLLTTYEGIAADFLRAALDALWAAKPATLWIQPRPGYAQRLDRWSTGRGDPWVTADARQIPLDSSFRQHLARARQLALLTASEPLFSDTRFDPPREALIRQWAA